MPAARAGLAKQIKGKLRQGDVFVSASPKVNDGLTGAANGDWVSWYIAFAQSPVVIGYNPSSKFAADFKSSRGIRSCRSRGSGSAAPIPSSIPKGALTVALMQQARNRSTRCPACRRKSSARRIIPAQVSAGGDAGRPAAIGPARCRLLLFDRNRGRQDPSAGAAAEITPKAVYTVTILHNAPNAAGADSSSPFCLGRRAGSVMKEHGLAAQKLTLTGDAAGVPKDVQALLDRAK